MERRETEAKLVKLAPSGYSISYNPLGWPISPFSERVGSERGSDLSKVTKQPVV